jgi:hypothetical protein
MQTFLPSSNFLTSAQILDSKRLNKQILEGYQILNVLSGQSPTGAWRNHPAVKMWRGHELSLHLYVKAMIHEAKLRGIKTDKNESNIQALFTKVGESWGQGLPNWFFDESKLRRVVTTHKANLFRKDPIFYAEFESSTKSPYNEPCCPTCKYYWVTHVESKENVL